MVPNQFVRAKIGQGMSFQNKASIIDNYNKKQIEYQRKIIREEMKQGK